MPRQRLAAAALCLLLPALAAAQPPGPVRMCAEWEPVEGVMIRWPLGIPGSLVAEMAEDAKLYVVILSTQVAGATGNFTAWGVNMANVRWVIADSYSHWSRDWGPQCLFDGSGDWGILDPWFDGYPWIPRETTGYEQDDDTPAQFAAYLGGEPLWQPPFYLTGGNIMWDGHGRAFCSEAQLSENDHLSEAAFRAALASWCGVDELVVLPNTEGNGIQHIDCVAKFLDEETVIVKQLSPSHPDAPYVEQNAALLGGLTSCYGNPLRVLRVDCGPIGGVGVAAYTNALILGKKVLVPLFQCAGDAPALQLYRDAMPGYEVIGFTGSWYYYDALHCRAMGIFDRGMLRVDAAPPPVEIPAAMAWPVAAFVDDRSEAGLDLAGCALHWRLAGETDFALSALVPIGGDSLRAWLPAQAPGAEIEYYLEAADLSGRVERRPVAAPAALFSTAVAEDETAVDPLPAAPALVAWPQPFVNELRLAAPGARGGDASVAVFDIRGRCVRRLALPGGRGVWDGRDESGRPTPTGIYLLERMDAAARGGVKVLRLRAR